MYLFFQNEDKDVYRPSSLRERDKHRIPLSHVFETEEKRKEIQKEIERAQRLLSEPVDQPEAGSVQDGEVDEGEELERVSVYAYRNLSKNLLINVLCNFVTNTNKSM